jgi:hypothetical protein
MFAKIKRITDLPYAVAASIAVASMVPVEANAASTVGDTAKNLIDQVGNVGKVVVAGGVVAGITLMITGLIKLKQAAETQGQQVKYSEGLWRCVVGAGMIALPAFNGMLAASVGWEGGPTISDGGTATF